MKIRPLHDRILVKRLEGEEKTVGGIIIPDNAKEKPMEGKVVAVGNVTGGNIRTDGQVLALNATAIPVGGLAGKGYVFSSTANFGIFFGSGAPTLAAAKGSGFPLGPWGFT